MQDRGELRRELVKALCQAARGGTLEPSVHSGKGDNCVMANYGHQLKIGDRVIVDPRTGGTVVGRLPDGRPAVAVDGRGTTVPWDPFRMRPDTPEETAGPGES